MGIFKLNGIDYMGGGGGGGNANEEVLTWAEYCALTPEEKMNNTTYYISDINGDGQNFQPVIYSLEEKEIGVWTDGKPLYQKTFYYASLPSNSSNWQLLQESYPLEELVTYNAMCVYSGDRQLGNSNYIIISYYNGNLYYHTPSLSGTLTDVYVTIQYTKTTDTPGSGTWTPQGVPAVHYSTEEQIVGTWIDGSTIYEKTFEFSSQLVLNANNWTNSSATVTGISDILDIVGYDGTAAFRLLGAKPSNDTIQLFATIIIGISKITIRYTKSA